MHPKDDPPMDVVYDPGKRATILRDRGLDVARAGTIFDGFHLTRHDDKHSGAEQRFHSVGLLGDEVVVVTWTASDGS